MKETLRDVFLTSNLFLKNICITMENLDDKRRNIRID